MTWELVGNADPRCARVYDRHYSRQTVGHSHLLPPGQKILLWHEDERGGAVWGVVRNVFRGEWRWRNAIFRNESAARSSDLIREAVIATQLAWRAAYGELPSEPLITEIDPAATTAGRSRWHRPGWCYYKAGWSLLRVVPKGHGRTEKHVLAWDCSPGQ